MGEPEKGADVGGLLESLRWLAKSFRTASESNRDQMMRSAYGFCANELFAWIATNTTAALPTDGQQVRGALRMIRDLLDWNVEKNQSNCADDPNWSGVSEAREVADAALTGRHIDEQVLRYIPAHIRVPSTNTSEEQK